MHPDLVKLLELQEKDLSLKLVENQLVTLQRNVTSDFPLARQRS